jgi:hypothetical protein
MHSFSISLTMCCSWICLSARLKLKDESVHVLDWWPWRRYLVVDYIYSLYICKSIVNCMVYAVSHFAINNPTCRPLKWNSMLCMLSETLFKMKLNAIYGPLATCQLKAARAQLPPLPSELLIDLRIRWLIDSYNDKILSLLHITFKGPFLI